MKIAFLIPTRQKDPKSISSFKSIQKDLNKYNLESKVCIIINHQKKNLYKLVKTPINYTFTKGDRKYATLYS